MDNPFKFDLDSNGILSITEDNVEEYLKGKSFIAKSVEQFEIRVHRVDISEEMRCNVLAAQKRQYR